MNKIALMEDDKTVKLSIPRGYYVFAEMSTMSDFNVKMMLRDAQSQKVSFEGERQSKDALPPIRGFYQCDYDETELHIHIEEGIDLDLRVDSTDLYDQNEELAVRTVTAVGRDLADDKYNDFMLHLTIMRCNFYQCDYDETELHIHIEEGIDLDLRVDSTDLYDQNEELAVRTVTAVGHDLADDKYNDFMLHLTIMRCNDL